MEDKKKFDSVLNYFQELGVEVPVTVKNSIEDVFDENEEGSLCSVEIFLGNDREELEKDLTLKNEVFVSLDNFSKGKVHSTFSYYGQVNFAIHEKYILTEGKENKPLEVLNEFNTELESTIVDGNDWAIILVETITFENQEYSKETVLKIFCPDKISEEDSNE